MGNSASGVRCMRIFPALSDGDLGEVRALFGAYDSSLDVDLSSQDFEEEIAALPGKYASPQGALFLARDGDGSALGCVAVRAFAGPCEMKRLYVRPAGRCIGAGRALAREAIAFAQKAGYREILLDSLPGMTAALTLYRALGFVEIPPYWNSPLPGTIYFRKSLDD
jgi:ribosomal protein S18 acetylase RimI-like enzyme